MNNQNSTQIKSWYEAQKNGQWKTLTNPLSKNSILHSQLNNFLKTIYQKFRQQKNLPRDFKSTIEFKGFQGWQDFPISTKMGHCDSQLKTTWKEIPNGQKVEGSETYSGSLSIMLSQKLLLSKLGMPELISDYQENSQGINWKSLPVSFYELIGTIAHEIAHAYQFLVNEDEVKSQCESTGDRDSQGKLKYPQLASEHTALTREIQTMTVKLPEYQKFKNWWEGKEGVENLLEDASQKVQKTIVLTTKVAKETNQTSTTQKSELTVEKAGKEMSDWPAWVFPVGIIGGIFLLGGIYWIFKKTNYGKAKN